MQTFAKPAPPRQRIADKITSAFASFLDDYWELASFISFINMLAIDKDRSKSKIAQIALEHGSLGEKEKAHFEHVAAHGVGAYGALQGSDQMLLQVLLCRAVDSYLCYISDLLTLLLKAHPDMLKGSETITYEEVLQHDSIAELMAELTEWKVHDLSYKGMRKLAEYIKKRMGFDIIEESHYLDRIVIIIEIRNLLTHNRGIVNRIFKKKLPSFPASNGQKILLDASTFGDVDLLAASVYDIEERAVAKWQIPTEFEGKPHKERLDGLTNLMKTVYDSIMQHADAQKKAAAKKES